MICAHFIFLLMKVYQYLTWPDSAVPAKQVQPSATQAEMLNDVENLHWLLNVAHLWLLRNDQVNIHISVNEIAICAASNSAFDTHQTVLLSGKTKRDVREQK